MPDDAQAHATSYSIAVRFGDALLKEGFTAIPNLILNHYARLGISPGEMMFTIHVFQHWWTRQEPHPSLASIADKMGMTRRQMRNYTQALREKGYLKVNERYADGVGQVTSQYDFAPLLAAVEKSNADHPPRNASSQGGRNASSQGPRNYSSPGEYPGEEDKGREDMSTRPVHPASGVLEDDGDTSDNSEHMEDSEDAPDDAEDRETIRSYISDFGRELRDRSSVARSTGRALKLYQRSGLSMEAFIQAMYKARAATQQHTGAIKDNAAGPGRKAKMAYFFACLEGGIGVRESGEAAS